MLRCPRRGMKGPPTFILLPSCSIIELQASLAPNCLFCWFVSWLLCPAQTVRGPMWIDNVRWWGEKCGALIGGYSGYGHPAHCAVKAVVCPGGLASLAFLSSLLSVAFFFSFSRFLFSFFSLSSPLLIYPSYVLGTISSSVRGQPRCTGVEG